MKWRKVYQKWEPCKYEARYKNHKITVSVKYASLARDVAGYWFYVVNTKMDKTFNSLHIFKPFKTIEIAQEKAVAWVDEELKGGS